MPPPPKPREFRERRRPAAAGSSPPQMPVAADARAARRHRRAARASRPCGSARPSSAARPAVRAGGRRLRDAVARERAARNRLAAHAHVAPRSISPCVRAHVGRVRGVGQQRRRAPTCRSRHASPGKPSTPNTRASTRFTLPSRIVARAPYANDAIAAAVERPMPGNSASASGVAERTAVLGDDDLRAAMQVARARVVAGRPERHHVVGRRRARRRRVAFEKARVIRDDGRYRVCCSMISDSQIRYGSRVFATAGRRPWRCHATRRVANAMQRRDGERSGGDAGRLQLSNCGKKVSTLAGRTK